MHLLDKILAIGGVQQDALFAVQAKVPELKNSQVINGRYAGGTATTVRVETEAGLQVIETAQAVVLTFTGPAAAAPAATPVAATFATDLLAADGTAAIGAVASGLKKGEAVAIPAGTLMDFTMQQALTLSP